MATYKENERILRKLQAENEIVFRCAISHLMDVGLRHLTAGNIEETCAEILKQDDTMSIMTNEFKCDIVRTAGKLAQIEHTHLLVYISKHVDYYVD